MLNGTEHVIQNWGTNYSSTRHNHISELQINELLLHSLSLPPQKKTYSPPKKKKKSNSGRHSEVIAGEQIVTTITIFIRILLRRGVVSIYASFQLLLLVRCQMHFSLEQVEKESILYFVRKMCCFCDTKNVIPLRNAIWLWVDGLEFLPNCTTFILLELDVSQGACKEGICCRICCCIFTLHFSCD